jgi:hypothetical protein
MAGNSFNAKKAILLLRLMYFAMIAGCVIYLIVVFMVSTEKFFFKVDFSDPLQITLLVLSISAIPFAYFYSKNIFNKVSLNDKLDKKFSEFQTGIIIRLAACEGVAFFSVINLLLTGNLFNIVFFVFALLVILLNYPSPERIGQEINLSASEIELFA